MTDADLCPACLSRNVIATRNGPTCTHQPAHNAAWFPPWWSDRHEAPDAIRRRLEFLELQRNKQTNTP